MALDKTIVKFKFNRPGAFSIGGHGNFYPAMKIVLDEEGTRQGFGNVWVSGHDYNDVYQIEMPDENVRELPVHIASNTDTDTKSAYKRSAAERAAEQHEKNNAKRDELHYHEGTGLITILYDSFYDGGVDPTLKKKSGRPPIKETKRPVPEPPKPSSAESET